MKKSEKGLFQLGNLRWTLLVAFFAFSSFLMGSNLSYTSSHTGSLDQTPKLTIYTYESLLNWGINATDANIKVFDAFEAKENCTIELEYLSDAPSVLARAVAEKNSPRADIIIGIDNVMIFQAKAQDILLAYEPSTSSNLSENAIDGLDPDFYVTPYDYGFIALVYHKNLVNSTNVPNIDSLQLSDLTETDVAKLLVTEDPTLSSTGLGFLMWTIGVYEKVLDSDWTSWWKEVRANIQVEDSWGDAFDVFYNPAVNRPIVVSYATDPAYNYLMEDNDTSLGATLSHENDSTYAWLQIEGLGILKGTKNLSLAQRFVDWFTGVPAQEVFPENNWMYPANDHAKLPKSFDYAIDPTTVTPLNDLFSPEEINSSLDGWLDSWNEVMILGQDTAFYPLFSLFGPIVFVILLKRKKKRI